MDVLTRAPSRRSRSRRATATSSSRFPRRGTLRFIGLSSGNGGTDPSEIKFALRLQGGNAEVRESGAYRTETQFSASDVMRIAYVGGTVQYSKNGNVFYTSGNGPVYPAIVDTTLFDDNATVWNVMISGSGSGSSSRFRFRFRRFWRFWLAGTGTADLRSGRRELDERLERRVNGNSLVKTGGCSGCPDAGAVSAQQISSGDGYVEFSGAGDGLRFIGLSSGNNGTDPSEIKFALRLQGEHRRSARVGRVPQRGELLERRHAAHRHRRRQRGVFEERQRVLHERARASYPMLVDTSLFDGNASINNVVISREESVALTTGIAQSTRRR